ncbi:MAG: hypothetical protein KDA75_15025 [Planctomycetaceae bacterium]|nr:hypothetical protein [Planctomycetaceae bacterium]
MNRAILEACVPWIAALAALCVLFVAVAWLSGGRFRPARIRQLHRSEEGAVQSLAFVLTMPLLVVILLFIVQVSQLMIGIMVVNYAAFASARSASVWIPVMIDDQYAPFGYDWDGTGYDGDDQNELPPGIVPGVELALSADVVSSYQSRKYDKIWSAAALACAPISPSRLTPDVSAGANFAARAASVMKQLYPQFDPAGSTNGRIPQRIDAKLGYSFSNTYVLLKIEDRNSEPVDGTRTYNPIAHPTVNYYPSEVGWQDPVTVTVYHDLALLPGAGPLLARLLDRADGKADVVSPRIRQDAGVHKTRLKASCTMTNEGIRSLRPYIYSPYP